MISAPVSVSESEHEKEVGMQAISPVVPVVPLILRMIQVIHVMSFELIAFCSVHLSPIRADPDRDREDRSLSPSLSPSKEAQSMN